MKIEKISIGALAPPLKSRLQNTADGFGPEQKEKVLPLIGRVEQKAPIAQMRVDQQP